MVGCLAPRLEHQVTLAKPYQGIHHGYSVCLFTWLGYVIYLCITCECKCNFPQILLKVPKLEIFDGVFLHNSSLVRP